MSDNTQYLKTPMIEISESNRLIKEALAKQTKERELHENTQRLIADSRKLVRDNNRTACLSLLRQLSSNIQTLDELLQENPLVDSDLLEHYTKLI